MTRGAVHAVIRHAIAITGFRDLERNTVTLRTEQIDQAADRIIDDLAGLVLEQKAKWERDSGGIEHGPTCGCDKCWPNEPKREGQSNVER